MAEYKVVEDEKGELRLEEDVEIEEDEDNPFSYWYELDDDDDKEVIWSEMAFRRFEHIDRWGSDLIEPTEEELFLTEINRY